MKVYPVRYKWRREDTEGTYYIVAETPEQAEEIAYGCIAANIFPTPEGPDRPPEEGRKVDTVWVEDCAAADTMSTRTGLIGTGSEFYNAKAYAEYIRRTGLLA